MNECLCVTETKMHAKPTVWFCTNSSSFFTPPQLTFVCVCCLPSRSHAVLFFFFLPFGERQLHLGYFIIFIWIICLTTLCRNNWMNLVNYTEWIHIFHDYWSTRNRRKKKRATHNSIHKTIILCILFEFSFFLSCFLFGLFLICRERAASETHVKPRKNLNCLCFCLQRVALGCCSCKRLDRKYWHMAVAT